MNAPHAYRRDLPKKLMRQYQDQWSGLPMPRLQLRWANRPVPKKAIAEEIRMSRRVAEAMGVPYRAPQSWDCFYEMVLPVDRYDIRNEHYEVGFIIIPICWTRRGGSADNPPCARDRLDTPYRDGSHAFWDSKALGWLPIYVVGPDGTARQKCDYRDAPSSWRDRDASFAEDAKRLSPEGVAARADEDGIAKGGSHDH